MTTETLPAPPRSTVSQRIIAAGIVIAFLYFVASVVITVLLSVLLAYFLDPFVESLESVRVPRVLGALIVVLVMLALVGTMAFLVYDRVQQFAEDWPRYSGKLRQASAAIEKRMQMFERRVSEITPAEPQQQPAVRIAQEHPVRTLLRRWLTSLYSILLAASFVPFLLFFMLAAKRDVWHGTLQLFPSGQRTRVKQILEEVSEVLRSFVVGNFLVAAILALASWALFWFMDLDFPFLAGIVSGLLNLVPYLGTVLAWVPPFVMGLTKWNTPGPFLAVAVVLSIFHLVAINLLMPALVGKRVHLNALAVTVALLFWGWMWGAVGLVLAIPITATIKVICDNVESWQPVGRWLGA